MLDRGFGLLVGGAARARGSPARAAAICPTSQGRPTAARPTITAAAPDAAGRPAASPIEATSPLAIDRDRDRLRDARRCASSRRAPL